MANDRDTVWADRYSRQIRFAPIGEQGQRKLADACVLIVGVGALGASLAQHMVRAGVGEVRLNGETRRTINVWVDADRLDAYGLPITAVRNAIEDAKGSLRSALASLSRTSTPPECNRE